MGYRYLTFGVVFSAAALLLAACQGVATQPPAANAPVTEPTVAPTATAPPDAASDPEKDLAVANPAGVDSSEKPRPKPEVPAPTKVVQPTRPPVPDTTAHTEDEHSSPSKLTNPAPEMQDSVFYDRDGLVLEFYWPSDIAGYLSADETEILAYNEGTDTIEFTDPRITFSDGGTPRGQYSGTWEKFPSKSSWDRTEYISIPPSPYQGEPLLVHPGEKVKIHWHLGESTSTDANQTVAVNLTVTAGSRTESIIQTLSRQPELVETENDSGPAIAPEPTVEHQEMKHSATDVGQTESNDSVRWSFNGISWSPTGSASKCPDPFVLRTPVDMGLVTGALWPGQQRGAYVAHGGFRFDSSADQKVTVRAPTGSHLVQASQYLEGSEVQYLLFFSVPCGFFYRFDHVSVVPPVIADALKDLPPATSGDSRTTFINPPLWVEEGEVVGTSVGISASNVFVDFGLYDVRAPNNVTPAPAWADLFAADKEFGRYGVCIFDYLPLADGDLMRSLPTGKEGKTSDFCQ